MFCARRGISADANELAFDVVGLDGQKITPGSVGGLSKLEADAIKHSFRTVLAFGTLRWCKTGPTLFDDRIPSLALWARCRLGA